MSSLEKVAMRCVKFDRRLVMHRGSCDRSWARLGDEMHMSIAVLRAGTSDRHAILMELCSSISAHAASIYVASLDGGHALAFLGTKGDPRMFHFWRNISDTAGPPTLVYRFAVVFDPVISGWEIRTLEE